MYRVSRTTRDVSGLRAVVRAGKRRYSSPVSRSAVQFDRVGGFGGLLVRPRVRFGSVIVSHAMVDVYSQVVVPIVGVLQIRSALTDAQAAWLIGIGSLSSGLSQPLSAWLADRLDSRLFAGLGLFVAAVCISSIGFASDFVSLAVLYALGMAGVGVYHPVGASTIGQLSESALPGKRSLGLSVFFVAGMVGGFAGSMGSPRITSLDNGFLVLSLLMLPGVVLAAALHFSIRGVPHREDEHRAIRFDGEEIRRRWFTVILLWVSNAMRFTVNIALFYLYVRWAEAHMAAEHPEWTRESVAGAAAPISGNLVALTIVGMAVGGVVAGWLVRQGREKLPLVLVPILFAPAIALFGDAPILAGYGLAMAAGAGFASMVPVTIGLAQRLLPHRTGLASGLMLGGAWAFALLGPRLAEYCLASGLSLKSTFALTAGLLALAGVVALLIRPDILRDSA